MKRPQLVPLALCVWLLPAAAQEPSADDFLPPVKGGPSDVKEPDKVEVDGDKVKAATAHGLAVHHTPAGWEARVTLDV